MLGIRVRFHVEVGQNTEKEQKKQKLSTWVKIALEVQVKRDNATCRAVQVEKIFSFANTR